MIRLVFLLFFSLSAFAQNTPANFDLQGHRGARGLMPENTIPAMIKAMELGVTTLELDVVITADRQVLVSHESWMNADICLDSNGREMSSSRGKQLNIYQLSYKDIVNFDCGSKKVNRFPEQEKRPVHKPLLSDLIQVCERYTRERGLPAVRYNIEIKSSPGGDRKDHPLPDEFADLVLRVLQQRNITDRSTIQSFDIRPLQYLNQLNAAVKLAYLTENEEELSVITQKLGFIPDYLSPYYKWVDKSLVDACHQMNMRILPWTVNEKDDMAKLIKMGVDGLITDYPDRAQEVLRTITEN